jgi:hypothetical protein
MRWVVAFFIFGAAALQLSADDLTTVDGKTYPNYTVVKAGDDGLNISYDGGTVTVPYYNLPLALQKQYGQDPDTLAAAKKAADAALANQQAADAEAKKLEDERKKQEADDLVQIKALGAARNANKIQLAELDMRVPDRTAYTGADYSYNKYTDISYLDSPAATATPMPAPAANDPLAGHSSFTLRTETIGPKPEQPDRYVGMFLSVSPLRKFSDDRQIIFLVDGITIPIDESDVKDVDYIAGSGLVAEYVSFYLTPKQVDTIINGKVVKFCVGPNNFTLNKDELAKLRTYAGVLVKDVEPASSVVSRKMHQFYMSIPPLSILISDICIYILTGAFTIVVFIGITACFVGASRFFKM